MGHECYGSKRLVKVNVSVSTNLPDGTHQIEMPTSVPQNSLEVRMAMELAEPAQSTVGAAELQMRQKKP